MTYWDLRAPSPVAVTDLSPDLTDEGLGVAVSHCGRFVATAGTGQVRWLCPFSTCVAAGLLGTCAPASCTSCACLLVGRVAHILELQLFATSSPGASCKIQAKTRLYVLHESPSCLSPANSAQRRHVEVPIFRAHIPQSVCYLHLR